MLNERMQNRKGGSNQRLAIMLGMLTQDQQIKANIPEKDRSQFAQVKWKFLIDAPFYVSGKYCKVMKKKPFDKYLKKTSRVPITGTTASESRVRTQKWLQNGCNAWDATKKISNPLSFWVEQDVLLYLYQNKIPIASVYGEIVKENEVEGQLDFEDLGIFELGRPTLTTTGCSRTGCMFCLFGITMDKCPNRLERMKITHPKQYEYIMKPVEEGGLGYKEIIDWINEHGNLKIGY